MKWVGYLLLGALVIFLLLGLAVYLAAAGVSYPVRQTQEGEVKVGDCKLQVLNEMIRAFEEQAVNFSAKDTGRTLGVMDRDEFPPLPILELPDVAVESDLWSSVYVRKIPIWKTNSTRLKLYRIYFKDGCVSSIWALTALNIK